MLPKWWLLAYGVKLPKLHMEVVLIVYIYIILYIYNIYNIEG